MRKISFFASLLAMIAMMMAAGACAPAQNGRAYDAKLVFPGDKYPQTAAHIQSAIEKGQSAICTLDRGGADANRSKSLTDTPAKRGFDRDEWPMALCSEGGAGADIQYVDPADNRGAGSWVSNAVRDYPDGTRILFEVSQGASNKQPAAGNNTSTNAASKETAPFSSCEKAKQAGAVPLHAGDPGYSRSLDRDGDGVACE